jgi:hypothetical protein
MRWLALTLGLVAACATGAAWIYLRDWERPRPDAMQRLRARAAAQALFCCARRRDTCSDCRIEVLDARGPRRWRIRIVGAAATRCFTLDLDAIHASPTRSPAGVRPTGCPS